MPSPSTTGVNMGYPNTIDSGPNLIGYMAHPASASALASGASALLQDTTYLCEVDVPNFVVVTNMRIRHGGTGASNLDMGIYDINGNLLDHTGVFTAAGANTVDTKVLSNGNLALAPGRYYFGLWVNNATDTYYNLVTGSTPTGFANVLTGVNKNGTGETNTTNGLLSTFTAMGGTQTTNSKLIAMMALVSGGFS